MTSFNFTEFPSQKVTRTPPCIGWYYFPFNLLLIPCYSLNDKAIRCCLALDHCENDVITEMPYQV